MLPRLHAVRRVLMVLWLFSLLFSTLSPALPAPVVYAAPVAQDRPAMESAAVKVPIPPDPEDPIEAEAAPWVRPQYTPAVRPLPEPAAIEVPPGWEKRPGDSEVIPEPVLNRPGPKAGSVRVQLEPSTGTLPLGDLPFTLASAPGTWTQALTLTAEVLDPTIAAELSPVSLAFRLAVTAPAGEVATAATLQPQQPVQLRINYSQLNLPYGGSFEERLTLYRATGCATGASSRAVACQTWEALPTTVDTTHQQLHVILDAIAVDAAPEPATDEAQDNYQLHLPALPRGSERGHALVPDQADTRLFLPSLLSGRAVPTPFDEDELYIVIAAVSSGQGNYAATPMTVVKDYQVDPKTGAAQTSYPIPVPPAPAGSAPAVTLVYNSGSVDGMHQQRNNQPSWVGLGWELQSGHITRHLKTCGSTAAPGDLCLLGDSYSIVLNGVAERLIWETGNFYRLENDPQWRVEKLTSSATGHPDFDKAYWRVTTPDGIQYRFGGEIDPETSVDQNSVYYVPVYDTTVCATAANNLCDKAWQWNLDRVEDTHGNVTSYFYTQETNYYNARNNASLRKLYVRAGYLTRIEYGRRTGVASTPTARIQFAVAERCYSTCTWPSYYLDTPGDLTCAATGTCVHNRPTFWTRKQLSYIETQIYNQTTSAWTSVARFYLTYTFPAPANDPQGDASEKKLWLSSITQKLGDGTGGLPAVQYGYTMLANRRNFSSAGVSPMYMPRLSTITTELGGVVTFTYGQSHPCPTSAASYVRWGYDCFPAWDAVTGGGSVALWNKWKVTRQSLSDSFSLNEAQVMTYTYSTPTWHYSDDPALPDIDSCTNCATRHWNDFRGSEVVTVTQSAGYKTVHTFHRGMQGDRLHPSGGVYSATTTLSDSSTRVDDPWLRGLEVENRRLRADSTVLLRTTNWFTATLTAGTAGSNAAYFVALVQDEGYWYSADMPKQARSEYRYDSYGNLTQRIEHGDLNTSADDRTYESVYLYNTSDYLVNRVGETKLWVGLKSGTAGDEQGYTVYLYDGATVAGTPPIVGDLTAVRAYSQVAPTAEYVETTTTYDSYGRPWVTTDGRGNSTTTAYHSFYGYMTSVTNDLGHVTSYVADPGWGIVTKITDPNNRITELQIDGYGRLLKVWLPSENRAAGQPTSWEFVYSPSTRPAYTKTRQLRVKSSSTYLESWTYVDGFGRELQTQQASLTANYRIVSSKRYNNQGMLMHTSAPYQIAGIAGGGYVAPSWSTVANWHHLYYEEFGRVWLDETKSQSGVLWSDVYIYDAWQLRYYNPNGRQTTRDFDAYGNLVQVGQTNSSSQYYVTRYAYNAEDQLVGVTDALTNTTVITYNLVGEKTAMLDPDMGEWQYAYDAAGNLTAQRDGRGLWLHMSYDDLNRLVSKRQDSPTGDLVAEYLYDAVNQKGLLSTSRAFSAHGTTEVKSIDYDARNRLARQEWVIPGSGGGTFRLDYAYNEADARTALTYPGGNAGQQGEVVTYGYNALGQLTSVAGSGIAYIASALYSPQGQITEVRHDTSPNGLTRKYTYETNTLRLSTVQAGTASPFENLQKLSYTYDNAGNLKSQLDTHNSGQLQCYRYDHLNQLTRAFTGDAGCSNYITGGTGAYNQKYLYDATGNITSLADEPYTYSTDQPHAVTSAFGNSYGYDANGNQVTRVISDTTQTTYTLTYDYENRLTAIAEGSTTIAEFVYDAEGNRVLGTVLGVTTAYVAGVYEYQAGATTKYYEDAGGSTAIRRAGYAIDNGVFYNLGDHLGSTSVLVNQNGTLNSRQFYYPFGANRGGSYSTLTTKRFTGQHHEQGLGGSEGIYDYGARWYDPQIGRFTSADTVVPDSSTPHSFNRYTYVLNSPLRYKDPTGHAVEVFDRMLRDNLPTATSIEPIPWPKDSVLTTGQHLTALSAAAKADIPAEFLLSVLETQVRYDYDNGDRFEDFSMKTSLTLVNMQRNQSRSPAFERGGVEGLAVASNLGDMVIGIATRMDLSLGLAQLRISTAQEMEKRYSWLPRSANSREIVVKLQTDRGNIHYTAAYLRYLTDLRTGTSGPHKSLPMNDMQIIYGAYRGGPQTYGGVEGYQRWQTPGPYGRLLSPRTVNRYRRNSNR